MSRIKRPTRSQKIALSKLTEIFTHAKKIGADQADLQKCVLAGHAEFEVVRGVAAFKITTAGVLFLQNIAKKSEDK